MFSIPAILAFLITNKSKFMIYGLVAVGFVLTLIFTYHKGYSNGVEFEKGKLAKEYSEVLEKKMLENSNRLKNEYEAQIESAKKEVIRQTIYVDRVKTIEKVVNESVNLNKDECGVEDIVVDTINKSTRRVK